MTENMNNGCSQRGSAEHEEELEKWIETYSYKEYKI